MWDLMAELFPIHRSIVGPGFRKSLEIIQKRIPLKILEYPSGTKCGSWIIPQEWDLKDAFIETMAGHRLIDCKDSNLQICQRSIPFKGTVLKDELLKHLYWKENIDEEAIPVSISYYKPFWGFSVSRKQLSSLGENEYRVNIDTRFYDGFLNIGECHIPGSLKKEIIIDSYLCHPSLANDNLSGVVVAVALMDLISKLPKRKYSYRLLLPPETIGPIVYYYQNPEIKKKVIGGVTLVCVGDPSPVYHFRKSRPGNTIMDKSILHSLKHSRRRHHVEDFSVKTGTSGNEKAYNSLGIELPISSFRRSQIGTYPEHLTSKDNLDFVQPEYLAESLKILWLAIQTAERSATYKNRFIGEPFLTGYGIYPDMKKPEDRIAWDNILAFADGKTDLLDIADKAGISIMDFDEPVKRLTEKKLIEEVGNE
jgi:aminopeptidase-like protein